MKIDMKNVNWLIVATIFTAAYAVWLACTLGWSSLIAFLTTNANLNEVGDFLAGAFAPIALIWLVAAVLTQRQELKETRAQFAKNQEVVDEQLRTIRSQNALLNQQHIDARENAKQAYKLNLFDKRMATYQKFIEYGEAHGSPTKDYDEDSYAEMRNLAHEAAFVFDHSIEEWFEQIAGHVYEYTQFKAEFLRERPGEKNSDELRAERAKWVGWLEDQFLPEERIAKFWSFMHVSDRPHMPG